VASFLSHAVSFSLLPLHTDTNAVSETLGMSADSGAGGPVDHCESVGGEVDVVKGGYLGRFTTDKNGSDVYVMHTHLLSANLCNPLLDVLKICAFSRLTH